MRSWKAAISTAGERTEAPAPGMLGPWVKPSSWGAARTGWPPPSPWPRPGSQVTVLEAADTIGGGTRSEELPVPGVLHDVCSAAHPFGVASPFLRSLDLEAHGLRWRVGGGRPGPPARRRSGRRAASGRSTRRWRGWATTAPPGAARSSRSSGLRRRDGRGLPARSSTCRGTRSLWRASACRALQPATLYARRWRTDEVRALFAGIAAHALPAAEPPAHHRRRRDVRRRRPHHRLAGGRGRLAGDHRRPGVAAARARRHASRPA